MFAFNTVSKEHCLFSNNYYDPKSLLLHRTKKCRWCANVLNKFPTPVTMNNVRIDERAMNDRRPARSPPGLARGARAARPLRPEVTTAMKRTAIPSIVSVPFADY